LTCMSPRLSPASRADPRRSHAREVIRDVTGRVWPPMALKLHPQRVSNPLPQLVGIDDLASQLGVSVRHIRRLVSERRIPFHKWGRLLRFDVDEVVAWLDAVHSGCDEDLL